MIDPKSRFTVENQIMWPADDEWDEDFLENIIVDWDTRYWYRVMVPITYFPPGSDDDTQATKAIEVLKFFIEHLASGIHSLKVNRDGLLSFLSSDYEFPPEPCLEYPLLESAAVLQGCPIAKLPDLMELERLAPGFDSVAYKGVEQAEVAFKYGMTNQAIAHI
jgi:hypothetical protein